MADVYYPGIAAGDAASVGADGTVRAVVTVNATYQVYELGDSTFSNPLTIKTPAGLTDIRINVGSTPIFPDVYVVSPNFAHNWKSGNLVFRRDSADAKDKAVADAVVAAQDAVRAVPIEVERVAATGAFRGLPGKDGSNVVPTAQAITTELQTPGSGAREAVSAVVKGYASPVAERPNALPVEVALTSPFAPTPGMYNLKAKHLRRFRAAQSKAITGTGLCRIGFAADSITIGRGLARDKQAWPVQLRALLASSGVPSGGDGFVFAYAADAGLDPRLVPGGSAPWNRVYASIQGIQSFGVGSTLTFDSNEPGSVAEVIFSNGVAGAFTVTIDGTLKETITASGTNTYELRTYAGLTDAKHQVVLTTTSGQPSVAGIGVRRPSGLLMDNGAVSGSKVADWISTTFYNYGPATRLLNPSLVFLALGTNDLGSSLPVATYKAQVKTLISRYPGTDIILVAPIPGNGLDWTTYRGALYEVANELDLPLLDLHNRWGAYATSNGLGLMIDAWHPTASGAAEIARAAQVALY